NVSECHRQKRAGPREEEVRRQAPPLVNILPAEEQEIFFEHGLDLLFGEMLADCAAVLMPDHAAWLIEHLPSALPRYDTGVGVFRVKRYQKRVDAPNPQEFARVEAARPAAAVETRIQIGDCRVGAMAHAKLAVLPPGLGEAGFLTHPGRIAEEDLA